MKTHNRVLVDLLHLYQYIRTTYREYALAVLKHWSGAGQPPFRSIEYDARAYLMALTRELTESNDRDFGPVGIPESTRLLLRAGLPHAVAEHMAMECYRQLVDAVSTYCPQAAFGAPEWDFQLVEPFDLLISQELVQPQADASGFISIAEEIEAQRVSRSPVTLPGITIRPHLYHLTRSAEPGEAEWSQLSASELNRRFEKDYSRDA